MDPVGHLAISPANQAINAIKTQPLLPSTADFDAIMAQERTLARTYHAAKAEPLKQPLIFADIEPPPLPTVETTPPPHAMRLPAPSQPNLPLLPVEEFAMKPDYLKKAQIQFDATSQTWSATWRKPQLFHYGMLLRPSLLETLPPNVPFSLQTGGTEATLTRTAEQNLILTRGNEKTQIGASELKKLLTDSIQVGPWNLSLSERGDLTVKTNGDKAVALAGTNR